MKENTKKLLESPILEDFLIGIELLYVEEGVHYFDFYDTGGEYNPDNKDIYHKPQEFNLSSGIHAKFIIIEKLSILIIREIWIVGSIEDRLKNTAWCKSSLTRSTIHEINPMYPWTE